jgi:hypothetical protein
MGRFNIQFLLEIEDGVLWGLSGLMGVLVWVFGGLHGSYGGLMGVFILQ